MNHLIATLYPSALHALVHLALPATLAFLAGWRWRGDWVAAEAEAARIDRSDAARFCREGEHALELACRVREAEMAPAEILARRWIHRGAFDVAAEGPPRVPIVGSQGP